MIKRLAEAGLDIVIKDFDMGTKCGILVVWPDGLDHAVSFEKPSKELTLPEVIKALTVLNFWYEKKITNV